MRVLINVNDQQTFDQIKKCNVIKRRLIIVWSYLTLMVNLQHLPYVGPTLCSQLTLIFMLNMSIKHWPNVVFATNIDTQVIYVKCTLAQCCVRN